MGMMATWMVLLVMLTQGGGGDLLDQVSTDAYWQAKSMMTVTPQVMREMVVTGKKADISREIAQLSSADAQQRVAAMKAIMAAGPGALPQLEELAVLRNVKGTPET